MGALEESHPDGRSSGRKVLYLLFASMDTPSFEYMLRRFTNDSNAKKVKQVIARMTAALSDKEKLAEKVAEFAEAVAAFETFLEIHQGDSDGPFLCGSDMCFGEAMTKEFDKSDSA